MRSPTLRRFTRPVAIASAAVLAAAGLTAVAPFPADAATAATVSVNAGQTLAAVCAM